ncbi:DUF2254 domain-containing protein [Adhaeribacter radiodurans]|uniref:DUF2254 domain-containing protein n=1 Tax=Adhaeribacter radiodurans TaxID=2745197 RepID=A0A7L7L2D4_9BACT|nr:DUF2254 domain-containing protein [Adhaeribacter radiodurans]QMU26609.1 DUF2254 domain-containing protein [Adhaeribacter radiodurans]
MKNYLTKWLKSQINRTITSIAFFPAITALSFLLLSWVMLEFDYSETGKSIKAHWQWLRLKDADTARNIISTVASGIISLTVFSFSMVMIVLNQAASQLSNRTLDKLIGNRFQQIVLGFYIGTIVYALFLLSTIRDIDSGVHVPALSTYLLIFFTVLDIFLFIYFLHYITQSVKYETIIDRIYKQTKEVLTKDCPLSTSTKFINIQSDGFTINAPVSGVFQGFERKSLVKICEQENIIISFLYPNGTYVLENTPLLVIHINSSISPELEESISVTLDIQPGEVIDKNYYYGFRQLMEVAIKALSPGINDPGTAVLSLHALTDLLAYRAQHFPETNFEDVKGVVRIYTKEKSFGEIFSSCILPIWDYGKNDRLIQQALDQLLNQLEIFNQDSVLQKLQESVRSAIAARTI